MGFDGAIAKALATHRRLTGSTISYRRGESLIEGIIATKGTSTLEDKRGRDTVNQITSQDFLFAVADLVIDDVPILPEDRDRIIEILNGKKYTYRILPGSNEKHYRYSDRGKTQFRIHTKLEGTEDAA